MNCSVFRSVCMAVLLLMIAEISFGTTAVVVPQSASDTVEVDQGHGVLLGANHLTIGLIRNGQGHSPDLTWSNVMTWRLEEVTGRKRSLAVQLPLNGPFAMRLPVGSYRVTQISLDSSVGTWHAVLPTTFEIRPWECTSLGTSMLQMQVGFVTGWITRRVHAEQELVGNNHEQIHGGKGCSTSIAELEPHLKRPVKLDLRGEGSSPN